MTPGIGGGLRRVRIRSRSSSAGSEGKSRPVGCSEGIWASEELPVWRICCSEEDWDKFPLICSESGSRGWFLWALFERLIMICDFAVRRTENSEQHAQAVSKGTHNLLKVYGLTLALYPIPNRNKKRQRAKGNTQNPTGKPRNPHIVNPRGLFWVTLWIIVVFNKPFES